MAIGGPEWTGLVDGIALGSRASAEILIQRLLETEASVAIAAEKAAAILTSEESPEFRECLAMLAKRGVQAS